MVGSNWNIMSHIGTRYHLGELFVICTDGGSHLTRQTCGKLQSGTAKMRVIYWVYRIRLAR